MQTQRLSGAFSRHGDAALKCNRPPTDSEIETSSAKKGRVGMGSSPRRGCAVPGGRARAGGARDAGVHLPA